jgi:hypothetical protein
MAVGQILSCIWLRAHVLQQSTSPTLWRTVLFLPLLMPKLPRENELPLARREKQPRDSVIQILPLLIEDGINLHNFITSLFSVDQEHQSP